MKSFRAITSLGAGLFGLLSFATIAHYAHEAEHSLVHPSYSWLHKGILSSYDHASICQVDEVEAMAAQIEIIDGPNDKGAMFTLPGKLCDSFLQPYGIEQAARFGTKGVYSPDLIITRVRPNAEPEMEERKLVSH
ncbi:hypothetical protein Nepgr_028269 [Nepenthes gracilis]|uniref:Uncharacterized protein n=1 Tax=Nepenthes gracilis TaxID=150966 RepID=A0AAD3TC50_NEPGR|nr:hypothetical protein Nepgr_028269 [Nepenthes gracilis]